MGIRIALCTSLLFVVAPLDAQIGSGSAEYQLIDVGDFALDLPKAWSPFGGREASVFRDAYVSQSRQIYEQYAGSADPTSTVEIAAFHIDGGKGTFAIVVMAVPRQADLLATLRSQAADKMAWGVRNGYINENLGVLTVANEQFSGFQTKAMGKDNRLAVSAGLQHRSTPGVLIQLTLLCPRTWDETMASETVSALVKSLRKIE